MKTFLKKIFPNKEIKYLYKFQNKAFSFNKSPHECYYKTLNCSPNSNYEDIKKEYYKLAKKYHPDNINSNSKENQNV
jgi:DnaJ-class molecular chaperone